MDMSDRWCHAAQLQLLTSLAVIMPIEIFNKKMMIYYL